MRVGMIDAQGIRQRWELVGSKLDERGLRMFAAGEVRAAGWGGLAAVSQITGLARSTIGRPPCDEGVAVAPSRDRVIIAHHVARALTGLCNRAVAWWGREVIIDAAAPSH